MAEKVNDILSAVSGIIAESVDDDVYDNVVNAFVKREVEKRTSALIKAFDALTQTKAEQSKIKPDIIAYDSQGQVQASHYSKTRLEELKRLNKRIEKIEEAINNALAGDYSKVYNLPVS